MAEYDLRKASQLGIATAFGSAEVKYGYGESIIAVLQCLIHKIQSGPPKCRCLHLRTIIDVPKFDNRAKDVNVLGKSIVRVADFLSQTRQFPYQG
jgi:hypothetical protein